MRLVRSLAQDGPVRHDAEQKSGTCLDTLGDLFHTYEVTDKEAKMVKLLSQIDPRVILGIGLNYKEHAKEQGVQLPERPLVFIKAPNSLSHPGDPIVIPTHLRSTEVDYEGELAVVIGRDCKNVSKTNALDFVLGYTAANDVSARDWQKKFGGDQFFRRKTFGSFSRMGPCLITKAEIHNPGA